MKHLVILGLLLIMGCASNGQLVITSSHPARIEVEGQQMCEKTPCETGAWNLKNGFGECVGSMENKIEAFPLEKHPELQSQYKVVRARCSQTVPVYFDMTNTGKVRTHRN